jgi:hypothetical protein
LLDFDSDSFFDLEIETWFGYDDRAGEDEVGFLGFGWFDEGSVDSGEESHDLDLAVGELWVVDTVFDKFGESGVGTDNVEGVAFKDDDGFVGVFNFFQEADKFETGLFSNGLVINFGKEDNLNKIIIFTEAIDDPFDFIFFIVLGFLYVPSDKSIVEFGEGFGHDFVYFFINELVFVIAEHFFELSVAIGYSGEGHFRCFNADKGEVLVFAHFDQVAWISLKFLGFLDVFLSLLISLLGFGQSVDIDPDIN